MSYHGYKVACGDQFPTYRSTWLDALSCAMLFTMNTGKDAKIYGIDADSKCHLIKTTRKNPPRT